MRRLIASLLLLALYVSCAGATIQVNDAGTWRNITGIEINDAGTWRQIKQVQVNDAGTWRTVWASLAAAVDDNTATGVCSGAAGSCVASTTTSTCSAVGGVGPFTFAWSYVSGTTAGTNSPSAAATNWTRNASTGPNCADSTRVYSATYRCTVTDTATSLTSTVDVTVDTQHIFNNGSC